MNVNTVKQNPALNEAQTNQMNTFIQHNIDMGIVSRQLTEYVIDRAGGWEAFINTSRSLAHQGIETGFKGFASKSDITEIFYAQQDQLISFANALSWSYDCDNAHDLALKFLEVEGCTHENIESVFESSESDALHEQLDCFSDITKWITWNGVQFVFDSYALHLKEVKQDVAA